eukprot:3058778-Prymnesium_polylepis.1
MQLRACKPRYTWRPPSPCVSMASARLGCSPSAPIAAGAVEPVGSALAASPGWTAKCRCSKRVNYRRRNATLTSP